MGLGLFVIAFYVIRFILISKIIIKIINDIFILLAMSDTLKSRKHFSL